VPPRLNLRCLPMKTFTDTGEFLPVVRRTVIQPKSERRTDGRCGPFWIHLVIEVNCDAPYIRGIDSDCQACAGNDCTNHEMGHSLLHGNWIRW
jgi:hypothetical protein